MPLFPCRQCLAVENTACCNYWFRKSNEKPLLCSACDPQIGKWHGVFKKRSAIGMYVDNQGHLWSAASVEDGDVPQHYTILGIVCGLTGANRIIQGLADEAQAKLVESRKQIKMFNKRKKQRRARCA
jgi:hypothetical protein